MRLDDQECDYKYTRYHCGNRSIVFDEIVRSSINGRARSAIGMR